MKCIDRLKVLSIEDNIHDAELITYALETDDNRFIVIKAQNKDEFETHLTESDFDIVLTDFNIMGYDGMDVIDAVKEKKPDIPIIVLTGTGSEEIAIEALKRGAADYVIKSPKHIARLSHTIISVLEDISNKQKIREMNKNIQLIVENMHDGILIVNKEGKILFINPAAERMFGKKQNEIMGYLPLSNAYDRQAAEIDLPNRKEGVGKGEINFSKTLWYKEHATIITVHDITERKQMENELKENQVFIKNILNSMDEALVVIDRDYKIIDANNKYCELAKKDIEDIKGKTCYNIYFNYDKPCSEMNMQCPIREVKADKGLHIVNRKLTINGKERFLEIKSSPMCDNTGKAYAFVALIKDITSRIGLQQELIQSQKMETIGALAGGIAHDFNNMLNVILGYSELIFEEIEDTNPIRDDVIAIIDAGKRAAYTTKQLLAFGRKQLLNPKSCNVNKLLKKNENIMKKVLGENINLTLSLNDNIAPIMVDSSQFEQVILNLAINARDAMDKKGDFVIETYNIDFNDTDEKNHINIAEGHYVVIAFTDNGIGMDNMTKEHIFEPFFTTKELGRGTGLGLSSVYGIIMQSGGDILVYSEKDRGTTFKIFLPQTDIEYVQTAEEQKRPLIKGNKEHILVVDDEPTLQRLMESILNKLNYTAIIADSGSHALKLIEDGLQPELIITDLIMPDMGGIELVNELKKRQKDVKIIYMSGYSANSIIDDFSEQDSTFLQKPFTVQSVSLKISALLGRQE